MELFGPARNTAIPSIGKDSGSTMIFGLGSNVSIGSHLSGALQVRAHAPREGNHIFLLPTELWIEEHVSCRLKACVKMQLKPVLCVLQANVNFRSIPGTTCSESFPDPKLALMSGNSARFSLQLCCHCQLVSFLPTSQTCSRSWSHHLKVCHLCFGQASN